MNCFTHKLEDQECTCICSARMVNLADYVTRRPLYNQIAGCITGVIENLTYPKFWYPHTKYPRIFGTLNQIS